MKILICGLTVSLGILANAAQAEQTLNIEGTDYPLSALVKNCQGITGQPAAQIACFNAISQLMEEQGATVEEGGVSVTQALDDLRAVAQYRDDDSGLSINAENCSIQFVYFNNYFHISRRNISTIDVFSAKFDASKMNYDQLVELQGAQELMLKGVLDEGATASISGGAGLESSQNNFAPRSPRTTIDIYANEVASQLPAKEDQDFEFVLVHPKRNDASDDIWNAFEAYVKACQV